MRFPVSKRVAYLVISGLVLLAIAGAADSIGSALRDNYHTECDPWGGPRAPPPGANETREEPEFVPPTEAEREECRSMRAPVTLVDAITRATMAPGIAIVAISAVFLVAAAIAARRLE
jgi:hypothetical protein